MSSDSWDAADSDAEDIATGLETVLNARALRLPGAVEGHIQTLLSRLSPAEADDFMSGLRNVGNQVGKFATSKEVRGFAGAALPIAGTAIGTIYGGPVGAQIGGSLGGAAGQAISGQGGGIRGAAGRAAPGAIAAATQAAQGAGYNVPPALQQGLGGIAQAAFAPGGGAAAAGSTAAAQLLSLIQNPAMMSSLLALAMGAHGRTSVSLPATGTEIPVGAMMNLVGTLAGRAAEDADDILAMHHDATPEYLLDDHGCLSCDPSIPSQRADALLRVLSVESEMADAVEDIGGDDWPDSDWDDFES